MDDFKDYGVEFGGPIVKDRLWAWGAAGKTDVTVLTPFPVSADSGVQSEVQVRWLRDRVDLSALQPTGRRS